MNLNEWAIGVTPIYLQMMETIKEAKFDYITSTNMKIIILSHHLIAIYGILILPQ